MTRDEMITMLEALYSQYPHTPVSPALIDLWHGAFGGLDGSLFGKALSNWALQDTKGFPPQVGMVASEIRKLVKPEITFEEAADSDHPLYQEARSLVYGKPTPYNAYAAPESMRTERDAIFIERRIKEVFEMLQEREASDPLSLSGHTTPALTHKAG